MAEPLLRFIIMSMFEFVKRHRVLFFSLSAIVGLAIWYFFIRVDTSGGLTVKKEDLIQTLTLSGGIDAAEKSTMTFQSTGKLAFMKVEEGDQVKKGQLLAGLDTGDLWAAERAAYYKYLAADAHAKYIEDTVKNHSTDESYLQRDNRTAAQTDRDIKYDTWLSAQRALRYATIYSPIDGIVYNVPPAHPGEFITATNTFELDIVNPQTIYFSATADQTEVGQIVLGQSAKVTLDALVDSPFDAEVTKVAFIPKTDETGTVYEVRLSLSQTDPFRPRLGMTGDVSFVLSQHQGVIAIPSRYLKTINGEKFVLKLVKGRKLQTKVETGPIIDGRTIILSGLSQTETIYDQTR